MSTTKKKILRDATGVSELNLPKWDRDGNDVKQKVVAQPKAAVVQTVTPDIEEETISAPTVKELEQIREDAYNEGFEQGYEQGLKQGNAEGKTQGIEQGTELGHQEGLSQGLEVGQAQALEEGRKATKQSVRVFQEMTEALLSYRQEDEKELETALGALAVRIARQVVQDELRTKPSHINSLVSAAVQALPNPDDKLTIRLNPIDYEFVESNSESNWELVSDDQISAGGCTIKSGYSYIDYTLEHRFETAVKQLISHLDTSVDEAKLKTPISDDYLLDNNLTEHKQDINTEDEADSEPVDEQVDATEHSDLKVENTEQNEQKIDDTIESGKQVEREVQPDSTSEKVADNTSSEADHSTNENLDKAIETPVRESNE
ncbi:FliH/SctL family protein [Reinekea sp.]|jgi:flagellar assembly protein FliH|uniref:flagellar assembly protein FliH n=1 Tax=Reinekea sp. TaxID=1970455 RepID=UPI00398961BA